MSTEFTKPPPPGGEQILTPDATAFVASLHRSFEPARRELLAARAERAAALAAGELPGFAADTAWMRAGDWRTPPAPADLADRRVEITGPTDRKMMINALNSGARVFMADLEDANCPTWANMVLGQVNLRDAVRRTITHTAADGRRYELADDSATLVVRPRGWHLREQHMLIDGEAVSASLFDFGLFAFHNARALLDDGSTPSFYLPKLQSHVEARLWHEVMSRAEELLGLGHGALRTTVLIEHVLAAFEMDEILYELRDRALGLNAGRWDYIFSVIKSFPRQADFLMPDRAQITMTVPFMRAYADLLVRTCHRRGAHAIGGMAAFIPDRRNPETNRVAMDAVRADKEREAAAGFDGTWVAHPDLVALAAEVFDRRLQGRPNQIDVPGDAEPSAAALLDMSVPGGAVTGAGVRSNIRVALEYIESWLRGRGAVAIQGLMEDTATAEISRAQLWQWLHHEVRIDGGEVLTPDLMRQVIDQEADSLDGALRRQGSKSRVAEARTLLEDVSLSEEMVEFLTVAGTPLLETG